MAFEEAKITGLDGYNTGMKKSLLDKVFFMDKIDVEVIVDYGCADGTLIHFLRNLFPEIVYYGFDISEEMIGEAKKKNPEIAMCFTTNFDDIMKKTKHCKKAVVLSSIIHEAYSYGTANDISIFWNRIFNSGFDNIVIRDMMPGMSINKQSETNDVAKILRKANRQQLFDFQQLWGSIENMKSMAHFLLKYQYDDNWEREVHENYFPIYREQMLSQVPDAYDIVFHEHFVLPYLAKVVKKDFGIELKENTHIKLILSKR